MVKNELIKLEKIDAKNIIEVSKWEEEQQKIVKDNPFVEIVDNATYIQAKANRTNLLKGRTALLGTNGQEGTIKRAFKSLTTSIVDKLKELSSITEPYYEKQQEEVKRYEAILEEKRKEKQRLAEEKILAEEKRKQELVAKINGVYATAKELIDDTTFDKIDNTTAYIQGLKEADTEGYEEYEVEYFKTINTLEDDLEKKVIRLKEDEERRLDKIKLDQLKAEFEKEKKKTREEERKRKEKADKEAAAERKILKKELEELRVEKARLKKIEDDRIAKEEKEKEKKEALLKEKARKKREKELQPDKDKALAIIKSLDVTDDTEVIKDVSIGDAVNMFIHDYEVLKLKYIKQIEEL